MPGSGQRWVRRRGVGAGTDGEGQCQRHRQRRQSENASSPGGSEVHGGSWLQVSDLSALSKGHARGGRGVPAVSGHVLATPPVGPAFAAGPSSRPTVRIVVTGSIATDHLMTFSGRFVDSSIRRN